VEKKYGGAPPIIGRVYEIWLVDANGWNVIDMKLQDFFFCKLEDDQRFGLHYGTTDGGFGSIVPLNENIQ